MIQALWGCSIDMSDAYVHGFNELLVSPVSGLLSRTGNYLPYGLAVTHYAFLSIFKLMKGNLHSMFIRIHFLDKFILIFRWFQRSSYYCFSLWASMSVGAISFHNSDFNIPGGHSILRFNIFAYQTMLFAKVLQSHITREDCYFAVLRFFIEGSSQK